MIIVFINSRQVPLKWTTFSDGAITCKLELETLPKDCTVYLNISPETPVNLVLPELEMFFSALSILHPTRSRSVNFTINLPYLPYGRADRVFEKGNPDPLFRFIRDLLSKIPPHSSLNIVDPHNPERLFEILEYSADYVGVVCIKSQLKAFKESLPQQFNASWDYVVAPDKGAVEKASTIADHLEVPLITANKVRDTSTGRITSIKLNSESVTVAPNSHVIICDDILDGGGTFIPLAEELKHLNCTVDLYITHMIAAKGLGIFSGLIDNIYYYHTVSKYINDQDILNFNTQI